jgi:serine/threonine protein kinase
MMYELITKKMPFCSVQNKDLKLEICKGVYPPLPADTSKDMINILNMMLQVNPDLRPACDDMLVSSLLEGIVEFVTGNDENSALSKGECDPVIRDERLEPIKYTSDLKKLMARINVVNKP